MSEIFARNALLFAGEMFLLSAVILALAWEASQAIRGRAALRHLVWMGAFLALIALPVLALLVPGQFHFVVPAAPVVAEAVAAPLAQTADVTPAIAAPVTQAAPTFALPSVRIDLAMMVKVLFFTWLAGVIALGLRGAAAAIGLRMLKRKSRPYMLPGAEIIVGPRYEIRIAREPNGYGPITWGLFRPVILLPFNAQFWTRERWQAVLLHETAHIARRDSITQMLAMIGCALYWPNPLVWMAARHLRNEAEVAADDAVIASGMRPSCYAGELLQLASEFRSREPALAGMPLFMAGPSALEARVKAVLASTQHRAGVTSADVLKIGGIALLATAALTFARPSFAQEEVPAPPPPPAIASAPLPPPASPEPADAPQAPAPVAAPSPAAAPAPVASAVHVDAARPYGKVRESSRMEHGHRIHRVWVDVDTHGLSEAELERIRPQIEAAQAQVRAAQPEIARAEAELRAHEAEIRRIQAQMPEIEARVREQMARIQPEIERALADVRMTNIEMHEHMDKAMKHMRLRIEMREKARAMKDDHVIDDAPDAPDDEAPDAPDDGPDAN